MDNVDDYVIQFDDASTLFVEIFAQTNFCALALRENFQYYQFSY